MSLSIFTMRVHNLVSEQDLVPFIDQLRKQIVDWLDMLADE